MPLPHCQARSQQSSLASTRPGLVPSWNADGHWPDRQRASGLKPALLLSNAG